MLCSRIAGIAIALFTSVEISPYQVVHSYVNLVMQGTHSECRKS